ncbi:MAG: FAD:protein FMN transferase [Rubripirellula sp.]
MKSDRHDTSGSQTSSRPSPGPSSTSGRDSLLTHVSHRAMATDFVVMLPEHAADGVEVVLEALEMLDSIEAALTIYNVNSEVSRLNRDGATKPVKMSAGTFRLLEKSILWSQRTSGAFDITAGPLVEAWGFTRRNGQKPTAQEIQTARGLVGFDKILLDPQDQTAQLTTAGMTINLGAIGKGDALDRLAAHLKKSGVGDFLIHGGNSSLIAAGDQDRDSGRGWAVGIAHPTKPKRRLCGLFLRDQALATSGSGKQFFHHQGRRFGHVIDPRTGYPAGDLASLTVLMESAADADAAATGLFVLGSDAIDEITEPWIQCPMIRAAPGRRQDEVEVSTIGQIDWIDPPAESEFDG